MYHYRTNTLIIVIIGLINMVSEKTKKLLLKYHLPLWLFIGVAFGWSVPIIGSAEGGIIPKKMSILKMSNIKCI